MANNRITTIVGSGRQAQSFLLQGEVCEWIEQTLGITLETSTFWERLKDGVLLCQLLDKCGLAPVYTRDPKGTFKARDNVAQFLHKCHDIGVRNQALFDTEDLIEDKNHRQVLVCILEFAKIAATKYNVRPTDCMRIEISPESEVVSTQAVQQVILEENAKRQRLSNNFQSRGSVGLQEALAAEPELLPTVSFTDANEHVAYEYSSGAMGGGIGVEAKTGSTGGVKVENVQVHAERGVVEKVEHKITNHEQQGKFTVNLDLDYNSILQIREMQYQKQLSEIHKSNASKLEASERRFQQQMHHLKQNLSADNEAKQKKLLQDHAALVEQMKKQGRAEIEVLMKQYEQQKKKEKQEMMEIHAKELADRDKSYETKLVNMGEKHKQELDSAQHMYHEDIKKARQSVELRRDDLIRQRQIEHEKYIGTLREKHAAEIQNAVLTQMDEEERKRRQLEEEHHRKLREEEERIRQLNQKVNHDAVLNKEKEEKLRQEAERRLKEKEEEFNKIIAKLHQEYEHKLKETDIQHRQSVRLHADEAAQALQQAKQAAIKDADEKIKSLQINYSQQTSQLRDEHAAQMLNAQRNMDQEREKVRVELHEHFTSQVIEKESTYEIMLHEIQRQHQMEFQHMNQQYQQEILKLRQTIKENQQEMLNHRELQHKRNVEILQKQHLEEVNCIRNKHKDTKLICDNALLNYGNTIVLSGRTVLKHAPVTTITGFTKTVQGTVFTDVSKKNIKYIADKDDPVDAMIGRLVTEEQELSALNAYRIRDGVYVFKSDLTQSTPVHVKLMKNQLVVRPTSNKDNESGWQDFYEYVQLIFKITITKRSAIATKEQRSSKSGLFHFPVSQRVTERTFTRKGEPRLVKENISTNTYTRHVQNVEQHSNSSAGSAAGVAADKKSITEQRQSAPIVTPA